MANELDTLLGVEGDGKPTATPADKKTDGDELQKKIEAEVSKVKDAMLKRVSDLKSELDERDLKIAELERTVQPFKPQPVVPAEDLNSVEGWKNVIKKETAEAQKQTNSEMDKIKQANWSKAEAQLAQAHGYDLKTDEGKAKLAETRAMAGKIGVENEFDPDQIFNSLQKAWAASNHQTLLEQSKIAERYKVEAESNSNDLAISSAMGSVKQESGETEATAADWRAYRVYQKEGGTSDMATFLKYQAQLR